MSGLTQIGIIGAKGLPAQAGVDRVVEAIVHRLDKNRFKPFVYVSSAVVSPNTVVEGVELVRIPTLPGRYFSATSLFLFAALDLFGWTPQYSFGQAILNTWVDSDLANP